MTYFTKKLHRRLSVRLRGYDYAWAGMYFVTVCTHLRRCLLGEIAGGEMRLNDAGRVAAETLALLPSRFPLLKIDSSVIMPNHVHALLWLSCDSDQRASILGEVVRTWKASATRLIRLGPDPSFGWQRNYHDRILRDDEVGPIRRYIAENPRRWAEDENHPDRPDRPG
jgi:putative transposase